MKEYEILCEKIVMDEMRDNTMDILNATAENEDEALKIVSKELCGQYPNDGLEPYQLESGVLLLRSHKKSFPVVTFKLKILS